MLTLLAIAVIVVWAVLEGITTAVEECLSYSVGIVMGGTSFLFLTTVKRGS